MTLQVISLGYEGRTIGELISILQKQEVTKLLDIRALPLSRKKGFSKKALSNQLAEAGICYRHIREAGNPYRKLKTNIEQCLQLYTSYLLNNPDIIKIVVSEIKSSSVALLCYEREHKNCHRSILIEMICQREDEIEVIKVE